MHTTPAHVSDFRANLNENLLHARDAIGRSKARRKVFEAVYRGGKRPKTVTEISQLTGLSKIRVLQAGGELRAKQIIAQLKINGETSYRKLDEYSVFRDKVLALIDDPRKAKRLPTKQRPLISEKTIRITIAGKQPKVREISIDDIDSFSRVRSVRKLDPLLRLNSIPERTIKAGLQKIVGSTATFNDWGGEANDLYIRLRINGKKVPSALALKGRGTQGALKPKQMGKSADQVGRLVSSPAHAFLVIYHSKIDESVVSQLKAFALAKAMAGDTIFYGVIDGDDLNRLWQAYRNCFENKKTSGGKNGKK